MSSLGLNKISISPVKVSKNALVYLSDGSAIVPIDTTGISIYSDYSYVSSFQNISLNSTKWRFYFRILTNKFRRIKLNKTYFNSGEFSIWSKVSGQKLNNLQRIEILPSKNFYF